MEIMKDEKDPKEDPAYYHADRGNNDDDESSNDDDDDDVVKDEEDKEEEEHLALTDSFDCKLFSRGNSSTRQWEYFFTTSGKITLAVGTILHYQWELLMAVGTHHWKWENALEVGMDRTFNSQQSSPKLDAASAIKFLELNALKSQQSSSKLDVQLLNLQVFLFLCFFLSSLHLPIMSLGCPLENQSFFGTQAIIDLVLPLTST
nr:hypothetical protein [Tanacetum cinerariifolium]